ncbi:outer spore coat protein CotE [Chryseomicrobium palamuruense]
MKNYRHIITKAIIAHGKKKIENKSVISLPQRPNRILGCWIVNHHYQAKKVADTVEVVGQFEVNIWYAFGGSKKTDVHVEAIHYKGIVPITHTTMRAHPLFRRNLAIGSFFLLAKSLLYLHYIDRREGRISDDIYSNDATIFINKKTVPK